MQLLVLFVVTFFNVFLLGLSSQIVRDQQVAKAFVISWGITLCQFVFSRVSANTTDPVLAFICSGFGGSIGIVASIYAYKWFINLRSK
ncbi:hypothetical protein [Rheinheimera sp. MM224]|uniref:hypothetical protein n=1 Tax=Rheinheimera sp. MM224 TaxID=3019969 RepID=UPI0021F87BB1|nr:hypothetical protein [Rheinheimera sp. MM224]